MNSFLSSILFCLLLASSSHSFNPELQDFFCEPTSVPCVNDTRCIAGSVGRPPKGSLCLPANNDEDGPKTCKCPLDQTFFYCDKNECLTFPTEVDGICRESPQCIGVANNGQLDLVECLVLDSIFSPYGTCICTGISVSVNSKCWRKANSIKDSCDHTLQCTANLDLAECNEDSECECTNEAVSHPNGKKCLKKAELVGEPCDTSANDVQCTAELDFAVCNSTTSQCQCNDDAVELPDKKKCLLKRGRGESCEDNVQCAHLQYSRCLPEKDEDPSQNVCSCIGEDISESYWNGFICLKFLKLDEECVEDKECEMLKEAECSTKDDNDSTRVCKCKDDTIQVDDKCWTKAVTIGQDCELNQTCTENLGDLAFCDSDHSCQCESNAVGNSEGNKCLVKAGLGNECHVDEQCVGTLSPPLEYSRCIDTESGSPEKICACDEEQAVEHSDGKKCLKKAQIIGEPCDASTDGEEQCTSNLSKFAVCNETLEECQCKSDAVELTNKTRCLEVKQRGESCLITAQCTKNLGYADCLPNPDDISNTICACIGEETKESYWNGVICQKYLELDEECSEEKQCEMLNEATCKGESIKTCQCKQDAVEGNGGLCFEKIRDKVTMCEDSFQCATASNNSQCVTNSENPLNRVCGCDDLYVDVYGSQTILLQCKEILYRKGIYCDFVEQCRAGMGNAICESNLCDCEPGFMFLETDGNIKCFLPKGMNEVCSTSEECKAGLGNNSECDADNQCFCTSNAYPFNFKCYLVKLIGDNCSSDDECEFSIYGDVRCDGIQHSCTCNIGNSADLGGTVCKSGGIKILHSIVFIFIGFTFSIFM